MPRAASNFGTVFHKPRLPACFKSSVSRFNLFTDDPNTNPDAKFIDVVENLDDNLLNMGKGTSGSKVGTGGMATKLTAAQIASAAGVDMVIANGADFHIIHKITEGRKYGTLFVSQSKEEVYLIDIIDRLL